MLSDFKARKLHEKYSNLDEFASGDYESEISVSESNCEPDKVQRSLIFFGVVCTFLFFIILVIICNVFGMQSTKINEVAKEQLKESESDELKKSWRTNIIIKDVEKQ
jgi:hypothetical protein